MDSFVNEIKALLEKGTIASMQGNALKAMMITKVQTYSTEIEVSNESISELFLDLTDLIVSGNLSRMAPESLKVYMALAVLSRSGASRVDLRSTLAKLSGIEDGELLRQALEDLRAHGHIDSVDAPALRKGKPRKGSEPDEIEEPS